MKNIKNAKKYYHGHIRNINRELSKTIVMPARMMSR